MSKNQKYNNLQTGLPRGSFSFGDQHPDAEDRFFRGLKKVKGGLREIWLSKEAINRFSLSCKNRSNANYRANKERCHQKTREWQQEFPEKVTELAARRRAMKKANTPTVSRTHTELIKRVYEYSKRLTACTGISWNVDHIIPISKGGTHVHENLQVTTAAWNFKKNNRSSEEWSPLNFN